MKIDKINEVDLMTERGQFRMKPLLDKINEIVRYINAREELEDSVLEQPHD